VKQFTKVRGPLACQEWGNPLTSTTVGAGGLGDILNTPAEQTYNASRSALPAVSGSVRFEHVTFRYRVDGSEILHDIDFDVPAGHFARGFAAMSAGRMDIISVAQVGNTH
jgi:ABC-type multidrug transport system fused ATPase/permease subunit